MIILFFAVVLMLGGCSGETIGVGRDDTAPATGEESILHFPNTPVPTVPQWLKRFREASEPV